MNELSQIKTKIAVRNFIMNKLSQNKTKIVEKKNAVAVAVAGAASAVMCSPCFAAIDLSNVEVDTTSFEAIAVIVLTAAVGFWGVKKAIALVGR